MRKSIRKSVRDFACCIAIAMTAGCSFMGGHPVSDPDTRASMQAQPLEPYWPFHLAEIQVAADSTAAAVQSLERTIALDSTYAPAVALLSKLYYDAGRHGDAVALLERCLATSAQAPDALRAALAINLEAAGDDVSARRVLDECAANSREVRATRTFVFLRGDEFKLVAEEARAAVDGDPESAVNRNNLGITLLQAGRPQEAREEFLAALKLDEKLPGAMYNMAIVEAFYLFDVDAGRTWFERYRRYATSDPDDLASAFGNELSSSKGAQN